MWIDQNFYLIYALLKTIVNTFYMISNNNNKTVITSSIIDYLKLYWKPKKIL